VYNRSIFIFGGYDGFNRVNDFFEYNVDSESWQEVIFCGKEGPPTPRHSHSAVVYEDCMYVFGGYDGNYKNDFYKFNFTKNQWTRIKPTDEIWPTSRYRTSCTVVDDKMYMFGGHDGQQQLNDFYYYNFKKKRWNLINYSKSFEPSPRDSHILAHSDDSIFLFGGSSGCAKSDFYQFKINEGEWKPIKHDDGIKPSCRFCHVGSVVNDKLYIFGGYDGKIRLNDFYFFVISKEKDLAFNSMLKFVNNPQYSDIILEFPEEESCDKKYIYAHRLLLSKYPYFEKMIDNMCGYDETLEETKNIEDEYPDEWAGHCASHRNLQSVKILNVRNEDEYSPEEEKEVAYEEIDESKDDIEFTEHGSFNDFYVERYSNEGPLLEDVFSDDDEIDLPLRIKMEDISYETCLDIIRYVYTDYCEVLLENAIKLLKAASLFQINRLKDLCERKISSSINTDNVANILVQAHVTEAENLKEMSMAYVVDKFDAVSKSDGFLSMVTTYPDLAVQILKRR
jgi:N-acetylneuraminic acid mutarotase